MAKGLRAGDSVTVSKPLKFKKSSSEYKNGLKTVTEGQVGQVVDSARGRSVIVEFGGKRATISSQRLQKVQEMNRTGRRRAAIANLTLVDTSSAPTTAAGIGSQNSASLFNLDSPTFAASIANKLLLNGGLKEDNETVVVEIHLDELPATVRERIQSLMQAKLSLGLEPESSDHHVVATAQANQSAVPARGRRGRKPKAAKT